MEANAPWRRDGNAAHGGSKMIPNEILAAWMVAAITGLAVLGGLSYQRRLITSIILDGIMWKNRHLIGTDYPPLVSVLESRSSQSGLGAEPLPFYYPNITTALRLPPPDIAWRSRLEVTGSLPVRPAANLADWDNDEVDEMGQR